MRGKLFKRHDRWCTKWVLWIILCCIFSSIFYFLLTNPYNKDFLTSKNEKLALDLDEVYVKVKINDVMAGKLVSLPQSHPLIIEYLWKNNLIQPPSTQTYNLKEPKVDPSRGQSSFVLKHLLKNMKNGFFVECGAMDGETRSNTLFMESRLGWKGLLIEADPKNYETLLEKHRKAWSANVCLAIKPHPHVVKFEQNYNLGKIIGDVVDHKPSIKQINKRKPTAEVQCVPLYSLMVALNVSVIDYFSLDVEGHELKVLETIPFDQLFIKTLSVEYTHDVEGKKSILNFMKNKGYFVKGEVHYPGGLANDLMFIHKSLN